MPKFDVLMESVRLNEGLSKEAVVYVAIIKESVDSPEFIPNCYTSCVL